MSYRLDFLHIDIVLSIFFVYRCRTGCIVRLSVSYRLDFSLINIVSQFPFDIQHYRSRRCQVVIVNESTVWFNVPFNLLLLGPWKSTRRLWSTTLSMRTPCATSEALFRTSGTTCNPGMILYQQFSGDTPVRRPSRTTLTRTLTLARTIMRGTLMNWAGKYQRWFKNAQGSNWYSSVLTKTVGFCRPRPPPGNKNKNVPPAMKVLCVGGTSCIALKKRSGLESGLETSNANDTHSLALLTQCIVYGWIGVGLVLVALFWFVWGGWSQTIHTNSRHWLVFTFDAQDTWRTACNDYFRGRKLDLTAEFHFIWSSNMAYI